MILRVSSGPPVTTEECAEGAPAFARAIGREVRALAERTREKRFDPAVTPLVLHGELQRIVRLLGAGYGMSPDAIEVAEAIVLETARLDDRRLLDLVEEVRRARA